MGNVPKTIKINCTPNITCCFRGNGRANKEKVLRPELPVCIQREFEEVDGVESKCKEMVGDTTCVYTPQICETEISNTQISNEHDQSSMADGFS